MVLCTWAYAPWPSHKTCEEYWCSSFICNTRCLIWSWLCASNGPLSSHEEARKWSAAKGDLPTFNIHRCLIRWMFYLLNFLFFSLAGKFLLATFRFLLLLWCSMQDSLWIQLHIASSISFMERISVLLMPISVKLEPHKWVSHLITLLHQPWINLLLSKNIYKSPFCLLAD